MAEIVNLRTARKQAQRREDENRAAANRLAHGVPRSERERQQALHDKAETALEDHRRIERDNDRSPA